MSAKPTNQKPGLPMKHLLLAMFVSVALIGCSDEGASDKQTQADIRVGKVVAGKECKACHGLDGKGTAPGIPNLAGQRGRYIMAALQEYKEGKRVHAALRAIATDLTDDQTRGVATFYASLKPLPPEKVAVFSPYENGKTVATACAPCHGADGNSAAAGTPNLAGQQPIYFVAATQEYLTGKRASAPMDPMLRKLSKLDIESVALFFASQTPVARKAPPVGDPTLGEPRTAVCGGCHGSHGVSTDAATPSLAAQDPIYLAQAIKGYRTTRKNDTCRASSPIYPTRKSTISSHSMRRRTRSRRKTGKTCLRISPTSAIVATPAISTTRRWRSRSSMHRTRIISLLLCEPIATASAEIP